MKLLSFAIALALTFGCGPSLKEQHLADVSTRRDEAKSRPGPRQVLAYAQAVHRAQRAGAYDKTKPRLNEEVQHAAALLERAATEGAAQAPLDAATMLGWKALLLVDIERYEEALAEFKRSQALHPNLMAGQNLVIIWGQANQPSEVAAVCAATVPVLTSGDDQYTLIELCLENMNAISEQAALAWASEDIIAFYRSERDRRRAAAAEAYEAQERADRRERRVEREADVCIAECKQRGYRCLNKCHGDASCEANCESSYQACLEVCDASAREALDE